MATNTHYIVCMLNDQDVIANSVYSALYGQLRSKEDITNLSELSGVPENILSQMLSQKLSRSVRRTFHRVKSQEKQMKREWKAGKTFMEIAKELDFAPLMIARLVLFECGWTKNEFNDSMRHPEEIREPRIKSELNVALIGDTVFSPIAQARAAASGVELEEKVQKWLNDKGIEFITEKQNTEHNKTPDFLLKEPKTILGEKAGWVECKSSFGDEIETRRNLNKQLTHYLTLFGPGIVVYGLGMVESPVTVPGIRVVSRKMLGL